MKQILAIDTSSDNCSIALSSQGQIFTSSINSPRQHSQKLLPLIDELLHSRQMTLGDIDAIAFGRGPGSFTGVRICLGIVQGLAYSQDIPVVPVSTLRAMAQGAVRRGLLNTGQSALIAVDARMDEVYWALYKHGSMTLQNRTELTVLANEAVSAPLLVAENSAVCGVQGQNLIILGSGSHYPAIGAIPAAQHIHDCVPHAEDILQLAEQQLESNSGLVAEDAQPVYLRDSVAWKKRQRIRH